jgi:pimeloyl-ACP methyl ester carboxylesterase
MVEKKTYRIRERKYSKYGVLGKENIISLGETNVHYRVIGKGPSLVVLHGRFQSTNDYKRLCRDLAHSFTVYAINHRGTGSRGVQGWITICKRTG